MTDLLYWCPVCRNVAGEVVGDDRSARAELARIKESHTAWHRKRLEAAK